MRCILANSVNFSYICSKSILQIFNCMKKYLIHLFVSLIALTLATACNEDPAAIDNAPEVFVYEAEDVMRTSAVLSGRLVASAQSNVREYGFLVGSTSDLTTADTRSYPIKGGNGEFSVQVVDLEIGTPYFYAVYASNGLEKMLSTVMAFTTPTRSGVLITDLQLVDENTATVSARIADNGGGDINAVGFCWGTDEKPTIFTGENCFAPLGDDNTFTASLPLAAGTTYSIRAFADSDITGDGTTTISYSQPISITLDEEPVVEDRWAICGSMNDWGDLWMEWNEELGYFVLYDLTISDEDEFRIRANGTWEYQFGVPKDVENLVSINEMAILTKDEGGNTQTMRPTEAGVYDLYFNPERPELWIMTTGYKPGETPEVEPTPIGEIDTADKKYKVRATVVYSLPSICILDDGTGLIPYTTSPGCPSVGTEIELYGYVVLIDQILNFSSEDSIEVISEGNPVNYHPEQMDSELITELLDGDRCREVTFTAQYDALTNSYWVDGQLITFMWTWDLDWEIPQQEVEVTGYYVGKFATDQGYQLRVLPREVTAVEEPLTLISAITETDAIYTVEGTVTAAQERAYILADKSGAILVYGADHGRSIGDRIRITARASAYDHMIQLNTADAVVELLSTGNSWNYNPTVMDGSQLDKLVGTTVCREIQFSGDLYLSGPYAEMTVQGATVIPSLSYCDNSQYTLGYNEIKGYYIGYTDRYLKVLTYSSDTGEINPEDTMIYYTSSDGSIVTPDTSSFGVNIVSNTYENGQGVITFDGEVTTIGDYAFFFCDTLTSITLPDCVTSIGSRAFGSCFLLENIKLPNNIVSIADHAFFACKGFTSITLPESLTSLGEGAFGGCSGLTSFHGKFATADHSAVIVDGEFIAFAPACGATEYVVPDGVTVIGDNAFLGCNLTSVTLPEGVETIKDYAFDSSSKITTITIPASVRSIGCSAFGWCSKLAEVYCLPTTPPAGFISYDTDEWYAFSGNASDRKIYVPATSLSAYKTATYWSDYADAIFPMDSDIPETWKICYTSTDGNIVEPFDSEVFGVNILSNTIEYDPYGMMAMGVITFDGPVTTIGENAFLGKETLATLTIPESVTQIANNAFESCKSLIGIEIPENVTTIGERAFSNCEALADLSLGSGLISIGNSAFSGCISLTSVLIPDSVTSIGNSAFNGCSHLLEITLSSNLELIDEFLLSACSSLQQINIPDRVKEIGYQAFSNCTALSNVSFGSGLERIGSEAFRYCTSLTHVELPYGLTFVGNGAFSYCYTLQQITMPASVTTLEPYAFDHCLALTEFTLPGKVTEVSNNLFYSCIKLQTVRLHDAITAIGDSAFYHCNSLTDITIPNSVTSLGNDTFNGCTSLRTVNIPNGVTAIGMDTFFGCEGITEITLPDAINSIGDDAFYGCKSLTEITIPASVASIGNSAFSSCESLTACYSLPTTPPAGANYMFDYNASDRKIYVPATSLSAYKTAAYWSDYADAIYPMDGESEGSAAGHKIYFKPNSNWKKDGALFAAYLYTVNSSPFMEQWVPMTESETLGIYEMTVPVGFNYNDGLIFVRMSNLTPENAYSWQYMWNQTVDLFFYDDGNDLFVLTNDGWEDGRSGRGIWYNYNDYILTMNTSNTWGVCGEFTNWGGISDIPMNEDSASGMFVAYNVEMEKDAEFKIRANNAWEESYGSQSSSSAYATINDYTPLYSNFTGSASNIIAPAAGIYDLYFDLKNLQLWLMRQGLKPGEKSAAPTISWRGYNIDNSYNYTDGMQLIMDITAQGGVAEFTVDIDSDVLTQEELLNVGLDSHIDLVNPGSMETPLETLGFQTKENVVGQSAISIDLTAFGELIKNLADHSFYTNFTCTVTDPEGQRAQKTLQLLFHAGSR